MRSLFKNLIPVFTVVLLASSSCAEKKTNTTEEIEIKSMDSTSRAVKENTEKLSEQTKKVEASLEKLDKEFKTDN